MARKTRRKAGRKAARRGHRKAARRRSHRRSRSSSRRRSSGRRRSSKRSRKAGRRSSGRRSSRGRFRRNGEDEFEMNGFEMNPYDGFEANAKKRGKGKKRKSSSASKFNKKLLKETGILRDFGPEPVAGMMIDSLADRLRGGQITFDQYKVLRKQIAKSYFPKQEGRGGKIGVRISDPITGKSKTVKVPWKGKVRTAFGPFKRRQKGGMYTYEWEKGEKIPYWALSGSYSLKDYLAMRASDQEYNQKAEDTLLRIMGVRDSVREAEMSELQRKIRKLEEKKSRGEVSDPMTPNKRGSRGRRRGKRRMSAAQKKALVARLQAGKRKARRKGRKSSRRGSSRRKGRKSSRRKARRSSRRSSRRGKGRRKARRSSRRSSRRGKGRRKGRRGFRRNFSIDQYSVAELLVGAVVGSGALYLLQSRVSPKIAEASPGLLDYTPVIVGTLGALATLFVGNMVVNRTGKGKDFFTASSLAMLFGGTGLSFGQMWARWGLNGIPYVNTSGWGSRRGTGAYELRGTGAYELRGAGGMGAYELRGAGGLGAYPQQALAGAQYAQALAAYPQQALAGAQYAQALAAYELRGLGQQPMDQELLPSHADAALDWADQSTGGEYVNSQLQPSAPLFFQDSLANLGVPSDSGGGIPSTSIWNPTGEGFVDPSATVGGIFDDPNV